jgi:hypothetical protein
MSIFQLLQNNKGTVSSALGKELAKKVLNGQFDILDEAIELSAYKYEDKKEKNIRSGAAKIVEIVAEKKPELVAPHLEKLMPALTVEEPQTRWMIIRTFGFCSHLNPQIAEKAFGYAKKYVADNEGLCIKSSADLYLGDLGAISRDYAKQVFPILEKAMNTVIMNEEDWIIESLIKLYPNLNEEERAIALSFARLNETSQRKATITRINKLYKLKANK